MPEDAPIDVRSAADLEPESEPPDPTPPKRKRNNRYRNKRDNIEKDHQRVVDKDLEINEEPEDIGSAHGSKDNTSEPSSVNNGGKDDVENEVSEDAMDSDFTVLDKEKLKASPNGGKEEYVAVNSAPNGGAVKAAKGRWW